MPGIGKVHERSYLSLMMRYPVNALLIIFTSFYCCSSNSDSQRRYQSAKEEIINRGGSTVKTRFNVPRGFIRQSCTANSFEGYLQSLPLKQYGSRVKYYNGTVKEEPVYDAVIDMDIGKKDLQQCADAIIRLRGEYFFAQKAFDKISFALTNGFEANYSEWIKGNRIKIEGNKTWWAKTAAPSNTYQDFRNYLDRVFMYAGTLSLSKSLHKKDIRDLAIGDVFITGGSPGHAIIVIDVALNSEGKKVFMLAQSYMPAQETHVLKNLVNTSISPWYNLSEINTLLVTPQWTFSFDNLKSW